MTRSRPGPDPLVSNEEPVDEYLIWFVQVAAQKGTDPYLPRIPVSMQPRGGQVCMCASQFQVVQVTGCCVPSR